MKTAHTIAEQEERKAAAKDDRTTADSSRANTLPARKKSGRGDASRIAAWRWPARTSGNPSGRPKHDLAAELAKAIFEENGPALYRAYLKAALRGHCYVFEALANRAFGKLKETAAVDVNPLRDLSEQDLKERIAQSERQLGTLRRLDRLRTTPRSISKKTPPAWL